MRVIEVGASRRTTASTNFNADSSRSHSVLELSIQHKYFTKGGGRRGKPQEMRSTSRLCLVDLAGSERTGKAGTAGRVLREGNDINKSLTVLGRCLKALVQKSKASKKAVGGSGSSSSSSNSSIVVPFRESVLTWYLKESLSGNARTTMLACVSPVASNREETLSTLRYAAAAKKIKTTARKNVDPAQAKIKELSSEIDVLKRRLAQAESFHDKDTAPAKRMSNFFRRGKGQPSSEEEEEQDDPSSPPSTETVSLHDKKADLARLQQNLGLLETDDFRQVAKSRRRSSQIFGPGASREGSGASGEMTPPPPPPSPFPMLSCLSKDGIMSHSLTISMVAAATTASSFIIGRSSASSSSSSAAEDSPDVDFSLTGMGIAPQHCQFNFHDWRARGSSGATVQCLAAGATVCVNGVPIEHALTTNDATTTRGAATTAVPLNHLDRLILGPCRLLCLFLSKPLEPSEREEWTYEAAVRELQSGTGFGSLLLSPSALPLTRGADIKKKSSSLFMSAARQTVIEALVAVEVEAVAQAQSIALEMGCAGIRFAAHVVIRGHEGLDVPSISMDE